MPCVFPKVRLRLKVGKLGGSWMGVIRVNFHSSGSSPSEIDMLNILVTASVILRAVILSIITEISSSPLDLVVSSECRRL